MADRQFGLELVITDKGAQVLEDVTEQVDKLGDEINEASTASKDLGTVLSGKVAPGFREVQKAGSDLTVAQRAQNSAAKDGKTQWELLKASLVNTKESQAGLTEAQKEAGRHLKGTLAVGLSVATGALRDIVRANEDASAGMVSLAESASGASMVLQGLAAGGVAGGLVAALGHVSGQVVTLATGFRELNREATLYREAQSVAADATSKFDPRLAKLAERVGLTTAELQKLSTEHRSAYNQLTKHAADNPEGKIAVSMDALTGGADRAKVALAGLKKSSGDTVDGLSGDALRIAGAAAEIETRIAAAENARSGSTSERTGGGGTLNTIKPLNDIMKDLKKNGTEAGDAVGKSLQTMRKESADAAAAQRELHDAAVRGAQKSKVGLDAMLESLQGISAASSAIGGRNIVQFAPGKELEMLKAQLDSALSGAGGQSASRSHLIEARKAINTGDLSAIQDIAAAAKGQAGAAGRYGGSNALDSVAFLLAQVAGRLESLAKPISRAGGGDMMPGQTYRVHRDETIVARSPSMVFGSGGGGGFGAGGDAGFRMVTDAIASLHTAMAAGFSSRTIASRTAVESSRGASARRIP